MTAHYDDRLTDFHVRVYNLLRESLLETGEPMRQGDMANKLREARAVVRNALVDLDKWGFVTFSRFRPTETQLTDPDRHLTTNPYEADIKGRLAGHTPTSMAPPPAKPKAPSRKPNVRMPWDKHG